MKDCNKCGFNDSDYGCTCPPYDKWYACPIENKKPENIQEIKDYAEWLSQCTRKYEIDISNVAESEVRNIMGGD